MAISLSLTLSSPKPIRHIKTRTVAKLIDFKEVDGKLYLRNLPNGKWRLSAPNLYGTMTVEIDQANQTITWVPKKKTG